MEGLQPFYAMEILAEAKRLEAEGRDICHLEVGEPAVPAAPRVREAVRNALNDPQRYTNAKGQIGLREALCAHYQAQHNMVLDPENIMVTMGSSAGFILAFLAGFAPGATIAVTRPFYPAYLNVPAALNMKTVQIPLNADNGWRLTAADIERAYAKTPFDGLLFASPANPTGAVVSPDNLKMIVETCARLKVRLIADEIYHGLDFTGSSVSAGQFTNEAIIVNSFSKYYCMTGWRIGWLVLPPELVRQAEILQQNLFISAPSLSQIAGTVALNERAYADEQKARYAQNRDILRAGLESLGFGAGSGGDGAFYLYADVSKFTSDATQFCKDLVARAGVAATPGVDFDRLNGQRFVRFSFAGDTETMHKALDRIERYTA